ncbi:hypothetical protein ACFX1X_043609 [Malus domestica]
MEGFRGFPETASLWAPEFLLPECVPGSSSSQNHIGGESHSDQTLEAAFSRLNVSAFSRQQQRISGIDCGNYSNGPALNYPSSDHGFRGGNSMPFCSGEWLQSRLNSQNGGGGDLGNFGLENCWVGNGSNGFVPNQDCWVHSDIAGFQEPLDRLSLADLRGNIAALAKQQHGCRFLQKTMEDAPNRDVIDLIFLEVMENVVVLMLDPYGNYVVQKLVEVCTEEQRTRMLSKLILESHTSLVCIALDTRGTRSVQKLLQYVTNQEQVSLIMGALSPAAAVLSKNNNGQHVIEQCLENFSEEDNRGLLLVVAINCSTIGKDKSGCCVLQKCIEHSSGENRERLVAAIIAQATVLAVDRYGNYVVQHLLGLRIPQITQNLLRQLQGSYISISLNKFGSCVVEKCLSESSEEQSSQIIFELVTNPNVSMLLVHQYGNFVIQTALEVSKGIYHQALLNLVNLYSEFLRGNSYGRKVLARLDRASSAYVAKSPL